MSDAAEEVKFSLKVMVNKQKTKVLFAEADSDFADVLLSFLTLPLGTIVRIMYKHYGDKAPIIGSLTTLYNGLSNLDSVYFWTESGKQMLLNPRNSSETECRKLKLNVNDTQPAKYFTCEDWNCGYPRYSNIGMYYGTALCACGKTLKREINVDEFFQANGNCDDGVFTIKTASFIICDDLRIAPNVVGSVMETLESLGITDTLGAELMNVTFGFNEASLVMDLLKGSFLSWTPLTDIILNKGQIDSAIPCHEPGISFDNIEKESISDAKKMTLKVMVQKSTNKLMFAQAEEDFVDFLFSLLTIPLGGVESLLGSNTSVKCIDNLHRSLANINDDKYLKTKYIETMLLKPKPPLGYVSKNQILPLTEEIAPFLYRCAGNFRDQDYLSTPDKRGSFGPQVPCFKSPKGEGNYVNGARMFMVTDDLTVTPLCMSSSLSILNGLEIPLSDVKELKLHIGLEEGPKGFKKRKYWAWLLASLVLGKELYLAISLKGPKGFKKRKYWAWLLPSLVLGKELQKPKRLTLSNWASRRLMDKQVRRLDAFVSFEIGRNLMNPSS
ncbi:hypothetical protein DH2020_011543 [Rehmannia glutinosa]|uniref:DUF674 domain-containing protein n=1 Tax=Rehmannia glutinosa TaxID=99300 RepID=A0ABR0XDY5_REHGL